MAARGKQPCPECGRPRSGRTPGVPFCYCSDKRRAAQRAATKRIEQRDAITELISCLDPNITADQVDGLIDEVAPVAAMRTAMANYVIAHPEVLTAGGSAMPKAVAEFIYAAITAGVDGLVSPACALCNRPRTLLHNHDDGERICETCYARLRRATCAVCGRAAQHIRSHTADGEPRCPRCHRLAQPNEPCDDCDRLGVLQRSPKDGLRYCRSCRADRTPTEPCSACGKDRRVNARTPDGQPLCGPCHAKTRVGKVACDECGEVAPLNVRAAGRTTAGKNICVDCYQHPVRECGICGRTRRVNQRATHTSPDICPTCNQAALVDCSVCGQHALGRKTTRNGRSWCFACQATARIDQLLTRPDGHIPAGIKDVRDALVATSRPRSILNNWDRTVSLGMLAGLARDHDYLTHDLLDAEGDRFAVSYLRALLVAAGALPERDEHATRLRRLADGIIDEIADPRNRQVLARYARWHVIARAKPDRHGQLSPAVADRCRQEIRAAQRFLDHLEARGRTIDDCTQADLDSWLSTRRAIRIRFPRWLLDGGHLPGLGLPDPVPAAGPSGHVDQDEYWALVRRMLHDRNAATREDRAAACLVLPTPNPSARSSPSPPTTSRPTMTAPTSGSATSHSCYRLRLTLS